MSDDKTKREFEKTIDLNLALLRLTGVVSSERASRDTLASLAFVCMTINTVSYVYEFATSSYTLATVLESFAMIIPLVAGQTRLVILLWLRDSCQTMLNICESFWSTLNSREKKIVQSYTNKAKLLSRCYLFSCVSTIFFYVLLIEFGSLIFSEPKHFANDTVYGNNSSFVPSEAAKSLEVTDDKRRYLPYAFFIDVQETPWYEIAYVVQLGSMVSVGLTCVGVDTTGPLLILIACGYFDTIQSRIENSYSFESPSSPPILASLSIATKTKTATETTSVTRIESSSRNVGMKNLRTCLNHHQLLLKLCEDIENLTNIMFLIQLITSTYNISLIGFKVVEDNPGKVKFVTQLGIFIIQLFLCNWPPDLLRSKSEAIGHAGYSMPWYRYPRNLQNPVNMLMVRGQKPVRLTAGKFIELSLETFASMISTAASFFTMMRSMN
ncbi:odorant receptor 13a-like [Bombus flavifrons]|uniref:odorant receptor 13a-like n=1 Tax=Bombus flavifrons TaxID=103934 RepID=UPI003703ED44